MSLLTGCVYSLCVWVHCGDRGLGHEEIQPPGIPISVLTSRIRRQLTCAHTGVGTTSDGRAILEGKNFAWKGSHVSRASPERVCIPHRLIRTRCDACPYGSRVCVFVPAPLSGAAFSPMLMAASQESRKNPKSIVGGLQACGARSAEVPFLHRSWFLFCFGAPQLGGGADSEGEAGTAE